MARTKQTARKCMAALPAQTKKKSISRGVPGSRGGRGRNMSIPGHHPLVQSQSDEDEDAGVNAQQFSIRFDDQAKCQAQCVQGKVIQCSNCQAIFTSKSLSYNKKQYQNLQKSSMMPDQKKQQKFLKNCQKVWICEFCLTHNNIALNYKCPQIENPCFLLQKCKKKIKQQKQQESSGKVLIFCIDISSSMQTIVSGKKTRLQSVKQALQQQVDRMKFQNQNIKVGIIAFGSVVRLMGGKGFKSIDLETHLFYDFQKIVQRAANINGFCSPLEKSYKQLKEKISSLTVYGSTALGPALVAGIQIASKGAVGSKLIICTDGQANTGIGAMQAYAFNVNNVTQNFYEKTANFAKNKRVSVSILSLKGDSCNLKDLGKLSLATGGAVLKIDPNSLGTQFSKITKQEILGTDSKLIIKVNKIFSIVSHNPLQLSKNQCTLTRDFGNFSSQTQLTFEFLVLSKQQAEKRGQIDMDLYNQPKLPMQIQLIYIGRDGNKYMQVINDQRQITDDKAQLFEGANFGLFAASVLQRASAKIKDAEWKQAESIIKGYWSLVSQKFQKTQTKEQLNKFGDRVKKLQQILNSKQSKKQGKSGFHTKIANKRPVSKSKSKKDNSRSRSRNNNNKNKSRRKSSSSSSSSNSNMSSDQEEQVLFRQMRARSRSRSRSKSPPKKAQKKKQVEKTLTKSLRQSSRK